ncbi:HEAT repeat domain-containing protein, partial [Bacillus cereus]|nr:HEAT repeat domain-containing protein [Bacillus cereus]
DFKEKYGIMSGSWRGKKPLQRNAILALAHFKEAAAIPDLIGVMKDDPRPVLRGTAAWALGKIGGDGVGEAIEKAMQREKDEEVLHEMNRGLELLAQKKE